MSCVESFRNRKGFRKISAARFPQWRHANGANRENYGIVCRIVFSLLLPAFFYICINIYFFTLFPRSPFVEASFSLWSFRKWIFPCVRRLAFGGRHECGLFVFRDLRWIVVDGCWEVDGVVFEFDLWFGCVVFVGWFGLFVIEKRIKCCLIRNSPF